jgi:chemotaxis protein MotB
MYRQRRVSQDSEDEHLDRWLVSYADYMTLMFALFVVLYSVAIVKEEEYQVLSETLGKVFETKASDGKGVKGEGLLIDNDPPDTEYKLYGISLLEERGPELLDGHTEVSNITDESLGNPLSSLEEALKDALFDLVENGYADVKVNDDWLTIELSSGIMFAGGSAAPTRSATVVLKEINSIIGPVNNFIRIRGYTDDQPINTELYASNWELSVARATAAVRILQSLNVNPARMAIEGYGQYSPFSENKTAQGRSNNRKVVIALSKYALDVTEKIEEPVSEKVELLKTADHEQMQVIELPSGGIRITTRRDNTKPAKVDNQDKK